jgi:hypothetical protein
VETQIIVTYEVIEPVSNNRFFTKDYYEAVEHYENGYIVYEVHKTTTQPSMYTQTQVRIVLRWHGNPQKYEV